MGLYNWVTVSNSWREIEKRTGTSGGAKLYEADTSNMITIANGTKIVYVENVGCGISGMTTGLINYDTPVTENSDLSNYATSGNHNYDQYGLTKIGSGNILGTEVTYGGIEAYSIHGLNDRNYGFYIAALGHRDDYSNRPEYFKSSYFVKSHSGSGWETVEMHGYIFAAITGTSDMWAPLYIGDENGIDCLRNVCYSIDVDVHCGVNNYEGIAIFEADPLDTSGVSAPDSSIPIANIGAWKYATEHISFNYKNTERSRKLYIYFRTVNDPNEPNRMRYASVRIIRHVYVNLYGNGNGISTAIDILPYVADTNEIVSPMSRAGESGGPDYEYKGIYDAQRGGNQIVDTNGYYVDIDKKYTSDSDVVFWWAHWVNRLSYSFSNNINTSIYCTLDPIEATVTTGTIPSIPISDEGVKCASGNNGNVTISYNVANFSIADCGKYLVPDSGLSANTSYVQASITFTSPSNSTCESETITTSTKIPRVFISPVSISSYETPPQPTVTQISNIPANGVTLNNNTISTYFSHSSVRQAVIYTNGVAGYKNVTYNWVGTSTTIPTLGNNYKPNTTNTSVLGSWHVHVSGEGGSECDSSTIKTAVQESNLITDVQVFTHTSSYPSSSDSCGTINLEIGESAEVVILARYTSGSMRNVSEYPENSVSLTMQITGGSTSYLSLI